MIDHPSFAVRVSVISFTPALMQKVPVGFVTTPHKRIGVTRVRPAQTFECINYISGCPLLGVLIVSHVNILPICIARIAILLVGPSPRSALALKYES